MCLFFFCFRVFTAVTWLTGARLVGEGCTVTALTWRVVMACVRVCMSTDLTPERRVYIPPHLLHRSSHDIVCQWYTVTSYIVPWQSARTVTNLLYLTFFLGGAPSPQFFRTLLQARIPSYMVQFKVYKYAIKRNLLYPLNLANLSLS